MWTHKPRQQTRRNAPGSVPVPANSSRCDPFRR
jgi:hypothetical protein